MIIGQDQAICAEYPKVDVEHEFTYATTLGAPLMKAVRTWQKKYLFVDESTIKEEGQAMTIDGVDCHHVPRLPSGSTLTGAYSIFYGDYSALTGVASSSEKVLTLNSDGRFKSSQFGNSSMAYSNPLVTINSGSSSSSKDEGHYEIEGYALTLKFDDGRTVHYEPFFPYFSDIYSGEAERRATTLNLEGEIFMLRD